MNNRHKKDAGQSIPQPKTLAELQTSIHNAGIEVQNAYALALQNWKGSAAATAHEAFRQCADTDMVRYEAQLLHDIRRSVKTK